jgi:hypothetical protein
VDAAGHRLLFSMDRALADNLGLLGFTPADRVRLGLDQVEMLAVLADLQANGTGRKGSDPE